MEIKKLDEDKCKNLKDLFIEWHERHEEDVNELRIEVNKLKEREYSCPSPRKLTKLLKEFGIPGCFSEWFIKDVDMGNVPKAENWEYVLKNAFNLDGGKKNFEPEPGDYQNIFLFKEANDSDKISSNSKDSYPCFASELEKENVNPWIYEWKDKTLKSGIPRKLPKALSKYLTGTTQDEIHNNFLKYAAYMNINKRGGESRTDERTLLNYAYYYRNYILKEIELLGGEQKHIKVFVCGSRYYFENLIKNLGLGFNAKDIQHAKYCFINITHPSARIGADKLFEEMNMEEVFGARLKKGNPVCVDKFAYY